MLDRLRSWFRGDAAAKSVEQWVSGSLSSGEIAASYGNGRSDGAAALIARATQWVRICAVMNAQVAAAQTVRLYTRGKGRRVSKSARAAMESGRLGRKAAEYASRSGDVVEVEDHPALDLVRKPNPWQTGNQLEHLVFAHKQLCGNAYIYLTEDEGGAPTLLVMDPTKVKVQLDDATLIARYLYGSPGSEVRVPTESIIHAKFAPGLRSVVFGEGPLHAVLREADLYANATDSELYRWANMSRPDLKVEIPSGASKEQIEQIKADLANMIRGVRNRGNAVFASVAKIEPMGWSPHEMEYVAGQDHVARTIWAAFGVPESVLRMNDANLASASVGNRQYMAQTIQPLCNVWAEELTTRLLPMMGEDHGEYWFAYDEVTPEDRKATLDEQTKLVQAGLVTPNEARTALGYDPLPGLDEVVPPRPNLAGLLGGDAPPLPVKAVKGARGCCGGIHTKDRGATSPHDSANALRLTNRLSADLEGWFRMALAEGRVTGAGWTSTPELEDRLRTIIEGRLPELWAAGGLALLRQLKEDPATVLPNWSELAANYARERAGTLIQGITATTREQVAAAVARGEAEGLSIRDVQVDLMEGGYDGLRAERIARTESANAIGAARVDGWRAVGYQELEWVLAGGPCALCQQVADRGPVPVGTPFVRAGETLIDDGGRPWVAERDYYHEALHPNCRCTTFGVEE
jgi:HK97 family phage portal protein